MGREGKGDTESGGGGGGGEIEEEWRATFFLGSHLNDQQ